MNTAISDIGSKFPFVMCAFNSQALRKVSINKTKNVWT